jgi:phage gp29-like protein
VREDIERFDALMLSATLNRDLVRPAVDLNFGPQKKYPAIRIGRPEEKDVQLIFQNLGAMVDRGLKIATADIYPLFGLKEPAPDAELLQAAKPAVQAGASSVPDPSQRAAGVPGADDAKVAAASPPAGGASTPVGGTPDAIDALADEMGGDMSLLADMQQQIEQAIDQSSSYEDLLARIEGLAKGPASQQLVDKLALSMFNARLAGELGAPLADAGA